MKRLQIMASIDVSVKHCSFWNICNICCVPSARAVGRAWTGNSWNSPSNRFYASLATRMLPLPWIKTMCFSAFWQSRHVWLLKMLHPLFILLIWCQSFIVNYFLIHSDNFRLHFYNIRQCQLTINCVIMAMRGAIVLPKVLWVLHLQITFDFNGLGMHDADLQINDNGNKLIQNWNYPIFSQVVFSPCLLPEKKCE